MSTARHTRKRIKAGNNMVRRERPDFGFAKGRDESMKEFFGANKLQDTPPSDTPPEPILEYYDVTDVIAVSQPVELDPEGPYQYESIYKKYTRLSRHLTVVNIGPGILYIRVARYNKYRELEITVESPIYEGEIKEYDQIYDVRLRSPAANLRYRVTEYAVTTLSGQTFSGSRFKERRDRTGIIVYQDDMESGTLKYEPSVIGSGAGTILRSTDFAYSGDFSVECVTGVVAGDTTNIKYRHPDFHVEKVGAQIHFSCPTSFTIAIFLTYHTGTSHFRGSLRFNNTGLLLVEEDTFGNYVTEATGIHIFRSGISFNVIKLSIDVSTLYYVSAVVNGTRIDLSDVPLINEGPETVSNHITTDIQNINLLGGTPVTVYFDNYIFTEDESLA